MQNCLNCRYCETVSLKWREWYCKKRKEDLDSFRRCEHYSPARDREDYEAQT
jgi:hypothetical protein